MVSSFSQLFLELQHLSPYSIQGFVCTEARPVVAAAAAAAAAVAAAAVAAAAAAAAADCWLWLAWHYY